MESFSFMLYSASLICVDSIYSGYFAGKSLMSLPSNTMKEKLQNAYFRAVLAKAGANFATPDWDCGIDFYITSPQINTRGKFSPTGNIVLCQLKASKNCKVVGDEVVYQLDAEAYNKLIELEDALGILVLLHLPEEEEEWLIVDESAMCIRYCCYWMEVAGETTDKSSTITVKIPRNQVFDPEAVNHLLNRVSQDTGSGRRTQS